MPARSTPVSPPTRYRDVRRLGTAVIVAASAWTLVGIMLATSAPEAVRVYASELRAGRTADGVLTGYAALSAPFSVAMLACFILGGLWLYRARANTLAIDPEAQHARGVAWVWFGWFLPIVGLWFPFQVVRDIVRASNARISHPLLQVWWGAWLIGLYGGIIADTFAGTTGTPTTVEQLPYVVPLRIVAAIATVVGLVCWVRIVRAVSTAQSAAATQRGL